MRSIMSMIAVLATATLWAAPVGAQITVTLNAQKDNTLYEDPAGTIGNGSGDNFFAGRTNLTGGGLTRRGLVAFDVAGGVPAGAFILDAKLHLFMSATVVGSVPVELHRASQNWAEGATDAPGAEGSGAPRLDPEATWIHTSSPLSMWTTPGGDFSPVVSASAGVNAIGPYTWNSATMAADVQNWLDNPPTNFGWLLLGREDTISTAKRFDSRTNPTVANRPTLEVTYVIPTTVTIPAAADNTLYEEPNGAISNGVGEHMFAGRNGLTGGGIRHRAVLRFNVTPTVPAGSVITGADLALFMSKTVVLAVPVEVHRLLSSWGEGPSDAPLEEGQGAPAAPGDATWMHSSFPGSLWSVAGGDFTPVVSAATAVDQIGPYHWLGSGMVADVQDMLTNPATNFGWLVKGDESTGSTSKRFETRENPVPGNRPTLTVSYYTPTPACLVVLTGDVNVSGAITSADIILMVNHVFKGGPPPSPCSAAGDVNCSGSLTSSDIIGMVNFVFKGGAAPCDVCTIIPAVWACP
jgi:hypothetical protein